MFVVTPSVTSSENMFCRLTDNGFRKAKKDVARCYTILTERKNAQGN